MNDKETLKCNKIVATVELERYPELIPYIKNRMDSDVGEEVMHRIRDNGDFIVRAKIEEKQFKEFSEMNLTETVEITRLIRCKDCDYYTAEERWCRRLGLCGAFGEDDFCCHAERRKE